VAWELPRSEEDYGVLSIQSEKQAKAVFRQENFGLKKVAII
jgi:hypothetical protein